MTRRGFFGGLVGVAAAAVSAFRSSPAPVEPLTLHYPSHSWPMDGLLEVFNDGTISPSYNAISRVTIPVRRMPTDLKISPDVLTALTRTRGL